MRLAIRILRFGLAAPRLRYRGGNQARAYTASAKMEYFALNIMRTWEGD